MAAQRGLIKHGHSVLHQSYIAELTAFKGVDVSRIGLFYKPGAANRSVHDDDDAVTARFSLGRGLHGFQQI